MLVADGGGGLSVPPGNPDTLAAAASSLQRTAGLVAHLGPDIDAAAGRVIADGGWRGAAADGFRTRADLLGRQADDLAPPMRRIAAAIATFATALRQAQADARTAIAHASAAQAALSALAAPTPAQTTSHENAISGAQTANASAWSRYENALSAAVSAVSSAERAFPQQRSNPPIPSTPEGDETEPVSLYELTDKINSNLGFLISPLAAAASTVEGETWVTALQHWSSAPAKALDGSIAKVMEKFGLDGLAYDRGEISLDELAQSYRSAANVTDALQAFSGRIDPGDLPALKTGGIPEGGLLDMAGRGLAVLGVASDVMTLVNPGTDNAAEGDVNRGMAAANIVGTGMAFAPAIVGAVPGAAALVGINAVADWVPVAGEVVMAGTALYLAGDWAYHNWDTIKGWGGDIYNAEKAQIMGEVHLAENVGSTIGHVTSTLASGAVDAGKSVVHDAGSVVKHLNPFSW